MATTTKQDVLKVLDLLPDEFSLEDVQYHLYVLQRIERGRAAVKAGRVISHDEVKRRLSRWLEKSPPSARISVYDGEESG